MAEIKPSESQRVPVNLKKSPLLSMIITSYTTERLKDIFELLDSIQAQTYKPIETIFVAERSQELYDCVKEYAEKKPISNLKLLFNHGEPGLSAARNLAIQAAKGEIIGFTDDDVILFPDWAQEMVKIYDDNSIIGVTGPALPLWEDESMSWFPEEFYWIISCTSWCGWNEPREVRNGWGENMSFRKEAFDACLFFDTFGRSEGAHTSGKRGPVGDDTEFSINLRSKTGKSIVYNPNIKVRHKVYKYRVTRNFIRRQAYWQGYTKAMFKKLYGNNDQVLAVEYELLGRITLKLLPKIARSFFAHPSIAWKRLSLTARVLSHLSFGYFSASMPPMGKFIEKAYR